jgi:hypothetical protein
MNQLPVEIWKEIILVDNLDTTVALAATCQHFRHLFLSSQQISCKEYLLACLRKDNAAGVAYLWDSLGEEHCYRLKEFLSKAALKYNSKSILLFLIQKKSLALMYSYFETATRSISADTLEFLHQQGVISPQGIGRSYLNDAERVCLGINLQIKTLGLFTSQRDEWEKMAILSIHFGNWEAMHWLIDHQYYPPKNNRLSPVWKEGRWSRAADELWVKNFGQHILGSVRGAIEEGEYEYALTLIEGQVKVDYWDFNAALKYDQPLLFERMFLRFPRSILITYLLRAVEEKNQRFIDAFAARGIVVGPDDYNFTLHNNFN